MSHKKLFLVTGMMRSVNNWKLPIEKLKSELPDFDIIAFDVEGMGNEFQKKSPLSIKKNVEFLRQQFIAQKGETNIILGFSLGGMIVSTWGQLYPNDLHGVILVTSSFGGLQPFWKRFKLGILPTATLSFVTHGNNREKHVHDMICRNSDHAERLIQEWAKEQAIRPVKLSNTLRQLIAGWRFNAKAFQKKHPTLVIAAPKDQLADYYCSLKIRDFLQADFIEHPTAGHDVLNDDPDWVASEIKKWIHEKSFA